MANFLQDAAQAVATGTDIDVLLIMLFRYFAGITIVDVHSCFDVFNARFIVEFSNILHLFTCAGVRLAGMEQS